MLTIYIKRWHGNDIKKGKSTKHRSMSFLAPPTYLEEALGRVSSLPAKPDPIDQRIPQIGAPWDRSRSNIQLLYSGRGGEG